MLFIPHPFHLDFLGWREGRGPTPDPAPSPGSFQPLFRPLDDMLSLKLYDRRENVKHQPSGRGGRVDVLPQGPEPGAQGLDQVNYLQEVLQAPGEAVVLSYQL